MKLKRFNSNHLKMIAIMAMTIDHIADIIYPSFPANPVAIGMHIIGNKFEEAEMYRLGSFIEDKLNLDLNPKGGK